MPLEGELTEEAKQASAEFNSNILYSHSVGFGPTLNPKLFRLSMFIPIKYIADRKSRLFSHIFLSFYAAFLRQRRYTGKLTFHWRRYTLFLSSAARFTGGEWKVIVDPQHPPPPVPQ